VKKILVPAFVLLASLMVMGSVSREWRPAGGQHGEVSPHDVHLKYYEAIRPSLVASAGPVSALCNGERMETADTID
jgi:hypothetical protein